MSNVPRRVSQPYRQHINKCAPRSYNIAVTCSPLHRGANRGSARLRRFLNLGSSGEMCASSSVTPSVRSPLWAHRCSSLLLPLAHSTFKAGGQG